MNDRYIEMNNEMLWINQSEKLWESGVDYMGRRGGVRMMTAFLGGDFTTTSD